MLITDPNSMSMVLKTGIQERAAQRKNIIGRIFISTNKNQLCHAWPGIHSQRATTPLWAFCVVHPAVTSAALLSGCAADKTSRRAPVPFNIAAEWRLDSARRAGEAQRIICFEHKHDINRRFPKQSFQFLFSTIDMELE